MQAWVDTCKIRSPTKTRASLCCWTTTGRWLCWTWSKKTTKWIFLNSSHRHIAIDRSPIQSRSLFIIRRHEVVHTAVIWSSQSTTITQVVKWQDCIKYIEALIVWFTQSPRTENRKRIGQGTCQRAKDSFVSSILRMWRSIPRVCRMPVKSLKRNKSLTATNGSLGLVVRSLA